MNTERHIQDSHKSSMWESFAGKVYVQANNLKDCEWLHKINLKKPALES